MKILISRMPETPKECLFSELDIRGGKEFYVCNLRDYIPEADDRIIGYKPKCVCRDCKKCTKLEVLK